MRKKKKKKKKTGVTSVESNKKEKGLNISDKIESKDMPELPSNKSL